MRFDKIMIQVLGYSAFAKVEIGLKSGKLLLAADLPHIDWKFLTLRRSKTSLTQGPKYIFDMNAEKEVFLIDIEGLTCYHQT